jgi:hypothetical protein
MEGFVTTEKNPWTNIEKLVATEKKTEQILRGW